MDLLNADVAQSILLCQEKVRDRLVKRNEERSINSLLYSTFADVKFEKIKSEPPKEKIQFKPIRYKIQSSPRRKYKKHLNKILDCGTSWTIKQPTKEPSILKLKKTDLQENENQRVTVAPRVAKKGKVEVEEVYENNWDLSLIDKMSPNVAKWIVYEKMKEPSDEADLKQRQKLSKLVTEKYGPTNQNENVELIPEDISETDIREFHEQCLEIGIDLDRLERVPAPEIIPDGDRLTLNDFVKSYDKAQEEVYLKHDMKKKVLNSTCKDIPKESVFKPKGPKVEFIKTIELNEKYHFVSDNDFEMKMISGEKVRFDQNVPEKNIVTLPNRNERFKLEWQQVYPTNINLQRGIHRGLVKWSQKPKLIDTSISQSVRETPAFKKLPSKPSLQHSMMDQDQVEGPVIAVACRDWQNEWGIAQNWQKLDFRNIKLKLNSIQNKDREEAVFSLTLAVIKARTVNGTIGQDVKLPDNIIEMIMPLIDDKAIRIRILAGILMKMCSINDEKVSEMYISLLHSPELEFPDRVLVSIVSVIFDLPIDNLVCESLLRKYFIEPVDYLLELMKCISDRGTDLMHSVAAEYLNSGTCEERSGACTIIGQLNQAKLKAPMIEKIIFLAWHDQNQHVRKCATSALGRLLENEKAIELCHSKLIEDLSNDDSTAHGLEMVIKLNFVSDYLINLMLKCFKSDRGMIRTQICETVTVMKLFNTEIIQEILQLMQFETIPEIKCAAIGALTALGVNSEEIVHALAWAVRFEDAPTCRYQAAKAILNLKLFHDKNVVETVRERTVVEDDPEVQAVLVDILKELNLTVDQVLEQHPLLTRIKTDIKHLCQKQNVIQLIVPAKNKKKSS